MVYLSDCTAYPKFRIISKFDSYTCTHFISANFLSFSYFTLLLNEVTFLEKAVKMDISAAPNTRSVVAKAFSMMAGSVNHRLLSTITENRAAHFLIFIGILHDLIIY